MASFNYLFGSANKIEQLFPPAKYADPSLNLYNFPDVIKHYTVNSLKADGLITTSDIEVEVTVTKSDGNYYISLESAGSQDELETFGQRHAKIFNENYAQKAIRGKELLKELGLWNPMKGFRVNNNATDGDCKWHLFPPLGLNLVNQKSILLMHYPPWQALHNGDSLNCMTLDRWGTILTAVGIQKKEVALYKTVVDVNPVSAPGSGQSEYPNDYLPIMMASGFFDGSPDRNYIRSMLELYLNPPGLPKNRKYTLPLLVCGSPLYDPQAPGWFRVAYKERMPQDEHGVPQVNVMQAGSFKVFPDSERETPYLICNHMIAAGVTGKCTNDPAKIPDIRQYEAQDLVSATFLKLYAENPDISPEDAKKQACQRWFGNDDGSGAPIPEDDNDKLIICALAQMDLFFEHNPPRPKYTYDEALQRCKTATEPGNPCCKAISPGVDSNQQVISYTSKHTSLLMNNSYNQYIISCDKNSGDCQLWTFDLNSSSLFKKKHDKLENYIPAGSNLVQVGDYILQWDSLNQDNQYHYRLLQFNPTASSPLGSYVPQQSKKVKSTWSNVAVQAGMWPKKKFYGTRQDFANPNGANKEFQVASQLELISMHNFVLSFIPSEGRGTNLLFNFDPVSKDPLPAPYSPQGAWASIELGHELMHVNGYVLDWKPVTSDYVIWQFDPQAEGSLSYPSIQKGDWNQLGINSDHQLCVIGGYVLDWEPANNHYRLWEFDHESKNGLCGPVKEGTLPKQITSNTSLTAIETLIPVNAENSVKPGTMDFMRDKIEHVVYYMIENRSFDHICGWLYEQNQPFNLVGPGTGTDFRGVDKKFINVFNDEDLFITKYNDGKLSNDIILDLDHQDPYHDNSDVLRQMFSENIQDYYDKKKPDMGGFAWNNGTAEVMQAYSPEQIPVLNGLAKNYAISDDWFSSMPSGTTVNRAFSLTGSSLGHLNNFQNGAAYAEWSQYPRRPSIWKTMWSNGIRDFKIYNSMEWMECKYTYNLFLKGQIPTVDDPSETDNYTPQLNQFFVDLKNGTLPKFSFLEPKWVTATGSTSYHPGNDLIPGERELNEIFKALQSSSLWDKTLLVITFDEHGGLPDHVPPPYAAKPWANDSFDSFTNDIMGVRVPTIMVSPYITANTVFRSETGTSYDSTSILSTLLHWMGIPKSKWGLGERTNQAPTFEAIFREKDYRRDKVVLDEPYDKNFPKPDGSESQPNATHLPIHDLHRLVVPGMIADMTPKLTSAERARITDEVLSNAQSLQDLHRRLTNIHSQHSS